MTSARTITLLDGGMGQELIRRSAKEPTPMWSAGVMLDTPDLVRDVHIDFINAGATVITLNAYSATPERLARDASEALYEPLQQAAVDVAKAARDTCGKATKIAGCLPPLFASYRPELAPPYEEALNSYRRVVETQAEHVDLFMCETMSSIKEAKASATAAKETGKSVWSALSVADDGSTNLRSGEALSDALAALNEVGVDAILLNCSKPESIELAWPFMEKQSTPIGAYANGFTSIANLAPGGTVASIDARNDLDPEQYAAFAMSWVARGASIIGGCCEIGPAHIERLHHELTSAGYILNA